MQCSENCFGKKTVENTEGAFKKDNLKKMATYRTQDEKKTKNKNENKTIRQNTII
jgi:hypothetical protein